MCGIIGYTGAEDAVPLILRGLHLLEYRGYDSAGIAITKHNRLEVIKTVGKVSALEAEVAERGETGNCALGHTRWATHGKPGVINSHPHTDCKSEVAVVHNGIIENYLALKEELIKKGHSFKSETDTEVIAHLMEENLGLVKGKTDEDTFFLAAEKTQSLLKGAFAVGVLWNKVPGAIIGMRRQSPLVAGLGKDGNFLASDVTAFLDSTKKAVFLEDDDIVFISPKHAVFYRKGKKTEPEITNIPWDNAGARKGGYKHFMLKEINEQPATFAATIASDKDKILELFGLTPAAAQKIKNVQIVASGTAYHAGFCGKYFIETMADLPVSVETASEYKYMHVPPRENMFAVALSQSGETADTIAAFKKAKELSIGSLAICNVLGAAITRLADHTFYTRCGAEISVASTKAFTAQLGAMYMFAMALALARGKITEAQYNSLYDDLTAVPELLKQVLLKDKAVKELADSVSKNEKYIFLGRNAGYPLALEAALKLKEISYLSAEGFAGGELKHGPIALISSKMPVLVFMPEGELFEKMVSSCQEVHARDGMIIAVTQESGRHDLKGLAEVIITLPKTNQFLFTVLGAVIGQLFAYYIADNRGEAIDQPRNLAKSVTVE